MLILHFFRLYLRRSLNLFFWAPWLLRPFTSWPQKRPFSILPSSMQTTWPAHLSLMVMCHATVVGVMKMGNTMPRVGLEPTSLPFWASVLPLHHIGCLVSPLYTCPPVCAAPCLRGQCRPLHSLTWNWKSFNAYNCIHTGNEWPYICIHRVVSTTIQHIACTWSWSQHQCHGCDENGKYCT